MEKRIFGISGEPGAGKDTVKKYLVERYGAQSFGFSLVLGDILNRLSLELCRKNYATLAEALRMSFGENVLSKALIADVKQMLTGMVVIDGIRKLGELDELRKLSNFHFIFVETDLKIRYKRIKNRRTKTDDQAKTFEEFVRDHEHDADREVRSLKGEADAIFDNNGKQKELFSRIDSFLASLGVFQRI